LLSVATEVSAGLARSATVGTRINRRPQIRAAAGAARHRCSARASQVRQFVLQRAHHFIRASWNSGSLTSP
jgi:hypothetical protein